MRAAGLSRADSRASADGRQPGAGRARSTLCRLAGPLLALAVSGAAASQERTLATAARGLHSELGTAWRTFTDTVMGGISRATLTQESLEGEPCLRLRGQVRLENNGGFVQMSLELARGGVFDATDWRGLRLRVRGNGEEYDLRLRTTDLDRPWQSYRASFRAEPAWRTVDLPFSAFQPHRTAAPLALSRLTRVGILGIGRAFEADVCVASVALYR